MAEINPNREPVSKSIPEWDQWMADHPDVPVTAPNGVVFQVPPPERWPDAALDALAAERVADVARIVLGDRYGEYTTTGANAAYLMDRIGAKTGVTTGESPASSS